jgi:hypothetical protein
MSIRCPAITGDGTNARDITKTAAKADKIIFSLYIMILLISSNYTENSLKPQPPEENLQGAGIL